MMVVRIPPSKRARNYKHGFKTSVGTAPEYIAWNNARSRCHNPRNRRFYRYGGRGIEMCARWRRSFIAFIEDVGRRPSEDHTLERCDNNRGYEPGNCVWATRKRQARNRSSSRVLTVDGRTQTMAAWAEEVCVSAQTIHARLKCGWTDEEAVKTAVNERRSSRCSAKAA